MLRHYAPLGIDYHRDSKKRDPILRFSGRYRFLSNFFPAETRIGDLVLPTSEHAFMWHKSRNKKYRQQILEAPTPQEAKRLGNNHRLYAMGLLREDWRDDLVRIRVMYKVLKAKYSNEQLRLWLHGTGERYLCEGNTWGDIFYGVCDGKGENHLGRLLMVIRYETLKG